MKPTTKNKSPRKLGREPKKSLIDKRQDVDISVLKESTSMESYFSTEAQLNQTFTTSLVWQDVNNFALSVTAQQLSSVKLHAELAGMQANTANMKASARFKLTLDNGTIEYSSNLTFGVSLDWDYKNIVMERRISEIAENENIDVSMQILGDGSEFSILQSGLEDGYSTLSATLFKR